MFIMLYSCIVWSLQPAIWIISSIPSISKDSFSGCDASKRGWVWSCRASKQRWNHWLLLTTAQWSCVNQCQLHGRSAERIYSYHPMLWSLWWDVSVGVTHPCCSSISLQKLCRCSISPGALRSCQMRLASQLLEALTNLWRRNLGKNTEVIETLQCQDSGSLWLTWLIYTYVIMYTWCNFPIFKIFHASRPGPASMRLITPIHPVRPPKKPRAPFSMIPQIA